MRVVIYLHFNNKFVKIITFQETKLENTWKPRNFDFPKKKQSIMLIK